MEVQSIDPIASMDKDIDQEDEGMYVDDPDLLPKSTLDTNFDGARFGMSVLDSDKEDTYKPLSEEEEEGDKGDGSDVVFKSPVRSGYLVSNIITETLTG
jgi:hypothetical protein